MADWRERHGSHAAEVLGISSATGAGLDELTQAIFAALPEEAAAVAASDGGFEAEHRVYRPGEEEGFDVVPEGDGRFRITGRGIELLIARHDLENPEALDYLERQAARDRRDRRPPARRLRAGRRGGRRRSRVRAGPGMIAP